MRHQLTTIEGPVEGRVFTLADGETLTIGRGKASDTRLRDPRISRIHCQVAIDGDRVLLTDLGSFGGTSVGGRRVSQCELRPGDVIQIGDTKFQYQLEGRPYEPTAAGTMFGRPKPPAKITPLPELVGHTLGHYQLEQILAKGHSGMVFKAHDTRDDRFVAVKVLAPEYVQDEADQRRFFRAMKTMQPIRHENIVQLYEAGSQGPHCWVAMELVEGESIAETVQRMGPNDACPWQDALRVAVHMARALQCAADHQIVHRNVTPPNILQRGSDKATKLADLTLAKALVETLSQQITQPGQLIGDVAYMSPERTRHTDRVDSRSDIYELGATLYAMLVGQPPFAGPSLPDMIHTVRHEPPDVTNAFRFYSGAVPELGSEDACQESR